MVLSLFFPTKDENVIWFETFSPALQFPSAAPTCWIDALRIPKKKNSRNCSSLLIFSLLGTQMPLKENPIRKNFNLLYNKLLIHHLLNIHWIFLVNLPKGIFNKPLLVIIEQIWIITIYIDNMILSQFSYLWFQFMVTTHVIAPWDVPYNSVFPTRLPFTDERKTFLN